MVVRQRRKKRELEGQPTDTRKYIQPNATNYNMATYERADLEAMSNQQLVEFLNQIRTSEEKSPLSPRDFHYIQSRLNEEE